MKNTLSFLSNGRFAKAGETYRRLFSISEIETNVTVQWFFGAMLLYFVTTFQKWVHLDAVSTHVANTKICWPYFPQCGDLFFLTGLPYGYTQNAFFMVLFGLMLGGAFAMWKKQWVAAHACLLMLFLWKSFEGFVLSYAVLGVYDYYHLLLTATILFLPCKEYFAKVVFVLLYFLSATIKLYPSWILGTYFTTLQTGLALFPDALTPLFTNIVIFSQVIGGWFLLSRNFLVQRVAFVFFEFFHFYSGIYIAFDYTLIAIPALTILFGSLYRYQHPPLSRRAIAGWLLVGALTFLQLYTFIIPGDQKMTLEGYRYGVWMFDANHQCVATMRSYYPNITPGLSESAWEASARSDCSGSSCLTKRDVYKENGRWVVEERYESPKSWSRCSPYIMFARFQRVCANAENVTMRFDHSINGGPFFRIVDEENICTLSYKAWWHNEWIKEPPEAPAIGYPLKNYYSELID